MLKDMLSENILRMEGVYVMGIGSITSTNSMSGIQKISAAPTDPKTKNIKNEITEAKQQMQKLSPKEELLRGCFSGGTLCVLASAADRSGLFRLPELLPV